MFILHIASRVRGTFVSHAYEKPDGNGRRTRVEVETVSLEDVRDDFSEHSYLDSAIDELFKTGHYYPQLKPIRMLRNYVPHKTSSCRKDAKKGTQLGDGTFFLFCLDCKHCLGFHLMQESEGPRTVCVIQYEMMTIILAIDT